MAALLAVLGGLAVFAAFPPISFAPSAPVGVALLTAALWGSRARRGVGLGFVSGVAFFLPLLSWMTVIGQDAWVLLALWCGAWSMLIGLITALGSRLPGAPVWIASGWVLAEALRGREPWGGFPWGSLSFSQADAALADWAAVAGTPVVTFVVALIGASLTALAVALTASRYRAALAFALTLVAAVALAPLLGPLATPPASAGEATIAIVQGGTPQTGMGAMDVRQAVLDNHIGQTLDLASAIDSASPPDVMMTTAAPSDWLRRS